MRFGGLGFRVRVSGLGFVVLGFRVKDQESNGLGLRFGGW